MVTEGLHHYLNTFCCDHQKIIHEKTNLKFKFNSLNSNSALNTAIANDISYDNIFSKQLEFKAQKGDLLIVISASGNSKNILKALEFAKNNELTTFGLFGDEGKGEKLTDNCFLVKSKNVQIIEDIHTIFMHLAFVGVINKIDSNKKLKFDNFITLDIEYRTLERLTRK